MRVALVCGEDDPTRDGVAGYVRRLAAALTEAGATATVVSAVPGRRGVRSAVARLRCLRPDVVHVQYAPSAYGGSAAVAELPALLGRVREAGGGAREVAGRQPALVTTVHEAGWPPPLAEAADRVVVSNDLHARAVRDAHWRVPVVVPVGANIDDYGLSCAAARTLVADRFGVPTSAALVVTFGFVHPVKGVRYLLEAVPELRRRHGDVRVLVAGGFTSLALPQHEADAFRAELTGRAAGAGVTGAVTFTGHLPETEVSALLRAADVVVLPMTAGVTLKSGALVAALQHGAAVAATLPDVPDPGLVDGATLVRIPAVRDSAAVAAAVSRLLGDPQLAGRVAAGGRALAADRTWPVIAQTHLRLYARLAP